MLQLASLLWLLLFTGPARADSKDPLPWEGVLPTAHYMVYRCDADHFTNNANPLRAPGTNAVYNIAANQHHARITLFYNVGQPIAVGTVNYSYRALSGGPVQTAEFGPAYLDFDKKWSGEVAGRPALLFSHKNGLVRAIRENPADYTYTLMSLAVPTEFFVAPIKGKFPFHLRMKRRTGSQRGLSTDWNEDYYGQCSGHGIREQEFERRATFAVAPEETQTTLDPLAVNRGALSIGAVQAFLRERLRELSPDDLRRALGVSLAALVAKEAALSHPAVKAAAERAYASVLRRLAMASEGAAFAEALSWRTVASRGISVAGRALSGALALLAGTAELSASTPEAPEFGGPGYFLTERGTRRLVSAGPEDLQRGLEVEPLAEAHLRELARVLSSQERR